MFFARNNRKAAVPRYAVEMFSILRIFSGIDLRNLSNFRCRHYRVSLLSIIIGYSIMNIDLNNFFICREVFNLPVRFNDSIVGIIFISIFLFDIIRFMF